MVNGRKDKIMEVTTLIENYGLFCKSQLGCAECDMNKIAELKGACKCNDLLFVNPQAFVKIIENWCKEGDNGI